MAIDYPRAMAAYKIGAEAGDAACQHQLGFMYYMGHGVAVDYTVGRAWFEKAAAQDFSDSFFVLGVTPPPSKCINPSAPTAPG